LRYGGPTIKTIDEWRDHWEERAKILNPVEVNGYCREGAPYSHLEYFETVVAPLLDRLELEPQHRVLDVGCGTGSLLSEIENRCEFSVGTDISQAMAERYKGRSKVIACAAHELPFQNGSFDRIVMNSVVHMFPSKEYFVSVVNKCLAILTSPGILLMGDVLVGKDIFAPKPLTFRQKLHYRRWSLEHEYTVYPAGWMADFLNSLDLPWSIMAQTRVKRKINRRFDIAVYKD
jgi:SAM-dependent methyltransferase